MDVAQTPVDNPVEANRASEMKPLTSVLAGPVGTHRLSKERVARVASLALHPFLVSPLSIVLILYLDNGEFWTALSWAALCAAFVVAPTLLLIQLKLKQKQYTDADISVRDQRHGLYLVGGGSMILCFLVLLWLGAPPILITSFTAALVATTAMALITRLWTKASIHTGVMTGVTLMVAFYSVPLALLLVISTLLVAWSRLVLQRHTLREAVVGGLVGVGSIALVFLPLVSL